MRHIYMNHGCKRLIKCLWLSLLLILLCSTSTAFADSSKDWAAPQDEQIIQNARDMLQLRYDISDDALQNAGISCETTALTHLGDHHSIVIVVLDPPHSDFGAFYRITVVTENGISTVDEYIETIEQLSGANFWPYVASVAAVHGKGGTLISQYGDDAFGHLLPSQQAFFTQAIEDVLVEWPDAPKKTYRYEPDERYLQHIDDGIAYGTRLFMQTFSLPKDALSLFDINATVLRNAQRYGTEPVVSVEFVPNVYEYRLASHVYTLSAKDGSFLSHEVMGRSSDLWRGEQIGKLYTILEEAKRMGEENGIYGIWSEDGYAAYSALWAKAQVNNRPHVYHTFAEPGASFPIQKSDALRIARDALASVLPADQVETSFLYGVFLYADDPANPIWCVDYITDSYVDPQGIPLTISHQVYISPQTGEVIRIDTETGVG